MAYATWSGSQKTSSMTVSGANLVAQVIGAAGYSHVRASIGVTSGKYYWEVTLGSGSSSVESLGVVNGSFPITDTGTYAGKTADTLTQHRNGNIVKNDAVLGAGSGWGTAGDVIGFALDFTAGSLAWNRNGGGWSTDTGHLPTGTLYPYFGTGGGGNTATMTVNFGASAFVYTPPADHIGIQELTDYTHAMTGGVSAGGDSTIILQPLYINMLAGLSAGGEAGVVFTNATRYVHAMTGGVSAGGATVVEAPRNSVDAALRAHTLEAVFVDAGNAIVTLPPHTLAADFTIPAALDSTLAAHTTGATGENGAIASLDDVLPAHTLDAYSTWHADNALPVHTLDATTLSGEVGALDQFVPAHTLDATGLPDFFGEMSSEMPVHAISVSYEAGSIGVADLLYGVAILDAAGFSGSVAALDGTLPPHTLSASGHGPYTLVASIVLAPHTLEASAIESVTAAFKSWVLNLRKAALTEYTPFQFNSFAVFNGKVYGAGAAGIMELGAQATDNGTSIASTVRTGQHAFGTSFLKRVPRIYVGYKATGDMEFRTITGEDGTRAYLLDHNGNPNLHQRRVPIGRGPKSPYWQFEFVNRDGADFTLDHVLAHSSEVTHRRVM
jgi:hypothetical protein